MWAKKKKVIMMMMMMIKKRKKTQEEVKEEKEGERKRSVLLEDAPVLEVAPVPESVRAPVPVPVSLKTQHQLHHQLQMKEAGFYSFSWNLPDHAWSMTTRDATTRVQ